MVNSTEAGIGKEFALARHCHVERDGEQTGDDEDRHGDEDENEGAAAAFAVAARPASMSGWPLPPEPPPPAAVAGRTPGAAVKQQARPSETRRSPTSEMMPTKTAAMTSNWTSAVLDVGQLVGEDGLELLVVERVHQAARVTVTVYWLLRTPVAKALRAGLSTMRSCGMVMPRLMHSVSRMFHRRGSALRSIGLAPVASATMPVLANQAMRNQTSAPMTATRDQARRQRQRIHDAVADIGIVEGGV
ncbi:MAG: hypothetical protein WDM94_01520 [Bauldia sp.]